MIATSRVESVRRLDSVLAVDEWIANRRFRGGMACHPHGSPSRAQVLDDSRGRRQESLDSHDSHSLRVHAWAIGPRPCHGNRDGAQQAMRLFERR
jgi:hypothetical protein